VVSVPAWHLPEQAVEVFYSLPAGRIISCRTQKSDFITGLLENCLALIEEAQALFRGH